MQEEDRPGDRARGGGGGAAAKMTAPRGGGDEPPPPPPSAGNEPVTPTSAQVSGLNRRGSRGAAMATFSMEVFDNEVVPSTLSSIAPILRVAAEIEPERPRVAYLCTCIRVLGDHRGFVVHLYSREVLRRLCLDFVINLASAPDELFFFGLAASLEFFCASVRFGKFILRLFWVHARLALDSWFP